MGERPRAGRDRLRARWRWLVLLACLLVALIAALPLADAYEDGESAAVATTPVSVRVDLRRPGRPVPRRFLGLSFELSSLGKLAALANRGDLVPLLRTLGPGVLRFGGISADSRVAWVDAHTPRPAWASSTLDVDELRMLRRLAERSGWRVILTLGFAHYAPLVAAHEVAAARSVLGSWLAGVEVGNEPDAYFRHGFRGPSWSPALYAREVASYRDAISRHARGVRILGPDASGSHAFSRWAPRFARALRASLLTGHHYPLGCHETPAPSIERLLSPHIQALERNSLERFDAVARAAGARLRVDEANSVSCGGVAGVSDTFAAALWAAGYIAQAMSAGSEGINLHGNPERCNGYSPVCAAGPAALTAGALSARPVWYALLLTSPLVGDRPVRTALAAPARPNVSVAGFLAPDRSLHFLIVDRDPGGSRAAALALQVRRPYRSATVLALRAGSQQALGGLRLGDGAVGANGRWAHPGRLPRVSALHGVVHITVPAGSAELVSVSTR